MGVFSYYLDQAEQIVLQISLTGYAAFRRDSVTIEQIRGEPQDKNEDEEEVENTTTGTQI